MVPGSASFCDTSFWVKRVHPCSMPKSTCQVQIPHYLTGPSKISAGPQSPTQMGYLSLPPDLPSRSKQVFP